MMNPFDPKSLLLAKHAQHVVLVHFPIALTITAIVFEWLTVWKPGSRAAVLVEAAYWNLTAAAATSVAAVATGRHLEPSCELCRAHREGGQFLGQVFPWVNRDA